MFIKEKISIEEFDDKSYQIRLIEPLEEEKAVLTHYLQNIHNGVSKYYKDEALRAIKNYVEYKNESEISIVAEQALQHFLFEVENVPFPSPKNYTFKFIDLFAGIGGFRIAIQNVGGKCVYTSEWNKDAQKTTEKILEKYHLATLQKSVLKIIFQQNLTCFVQVFLVKHFP